MKRILATAALSVSALAVSASASFADYTLNILHINDWHSRIESNNKYESTCSAEDETKGECFGGAARLVTAINQMREKLKDQNVILLNGGDNFQGSLFYTTYKGKVEAEFLNQMKFDAMTVGNHEFDDGEDALVPFLKEIQFPILSVNVKPDAQSKVGDMIKPSVVLEVGGQKIGIVGAVTTETPDIASPGPHIAIEDDVANITAEVKKLASEGVDKIIALTHVGYPRDLEMIATIPGVDVVVGGHTHTLLSNTDPKAAGPYPTWVDNPLGYRVPVVQAASYSKLLGDLKVTFNDIGIVKEASGDPLALDKSITPDEGVLKRVAELGAPIEELKKKEVGATTAAIDGSRDSCRARECEMGNLVSDAVLDRTKSQGVTIAISNGGGLRASIDEGVITMGEVLTVLPFQNTVATFQIKGEDLVAALEGGLSQLEDGAGRFPQVAGLKYSFDKSVAPNEGRVKSVEVMEGDKWQPIDPAKVYTVATNNYVRGGGDGYKTFAEKATNAYDFGPGLEQVVADYLTAHNPYTPKLEGRITELAQAAMPASEEEKPAEAAPAAEAKPAEPAPAAKPAEPAPAAEAKPAEPVVTTPELPAGSNDITKTPPTITPEPAPAAEEPAKPEQKPAETMPAQKPAETMPAQTMPESQEKEHVVVAGDNLWKIAETYYGDGNKWQVIAEANPQYKPKFLPVGATLKIPAAN
ncbi:MAG: 5'-nucleotidase C-terminal domain-containing protein [Rhizobiaceae bacterium]|nr:5'-nucleotidase C-terminal domain-containing protein [Rhizobiaceae bacterium]